MFVIVPVAFTLMGIGINDHYNIKNLEEHSEDVQAELLLHIERKSRSYESLSKGNLESIMSLDSAQQKIDSLLIEKYQVRSSRGSSLSEF